MMGIDVPVEGSLVETLQTTFLARGEAAVSIAEQTIEFVGAE
jgi:hypothetical protein